MREGYSLNETPDHDESMSRKTKMNLTEKTEEGAFDKNHSNL